jgi:hypothetical protein
MVQNRLTVCILLQEMQVVLEKAIQLRRLLPHSSEQLQGLELVRQITQSSTQISEQPKVLVRPLPAMKPSDYTSHLERQLVKGLVVLVPQSFIAIFVPQVLRVAQQLQTKQLAYTRLQETQLGLALEQRTLMSSRFYSEQHCLMVSLLQARFNSARLLVLQMAMVRAVNLYPSN